jgi:glycosyltransferase involved in cell wall biosynthesis
VNILFFSEPSYPRHLGGAGKCAHLLAAGLVARGHEVALVCPTGGGDAVTERIRGVDVHRVPMATRKLMAGNGEASTAGAILEYVKAKIPLDRVDIVHDAGGFLSYFYPVEFYLRASLGVPLVVHFQFLNAGYQLALSDPGFSPAFLGLESSLENRVQCFPSRIADAIIFTSFEEAALGSRLYRPAPDRVSVVANAVETRIDWHRCRTVWRERLAPAGGPLVVFGGRIDSPMKGPDLVAAAFARIVSVRPDTRLVLLNSGARVPPPFQPFADAIVPLGWMPDDSTVTAILSAADVVVVPSRYEPFGMMCAEAMAAGVPVVATATGGLREMVVHGQNGFLIRARDAARVEQELADYVVRLLNDSDLRRRLGGNARRSVHERYSVDVVTAAVEAIYQTLPPSGSRRGVAAPDMPVGDEERYLSVLERMAGSEGRSAGERVLANWRVAIESRCLACTRGRLAREALALLAFDARANSNPAVARDHESRARLHRTVEAACPLGLVQRSIGNRRRIAAQE